MTDAVRAWRERLIAIYGVELFRKIEENIMRELAKQSKENS